MSKSVCSFILTGARHVVLHRERRKLSASTLNEGAISQIPEFNQLTRIATYMLPTSESLKVFSVNTCCY
jgi:hypothetical protein